MLQGFSQLPRPVQGVLLLGSGAGLTSVVMSFVYPNVVLYRYLAIGFVVLALLVGLYKLLTVLRNKGKSGPFASLLSKSSRSASDPALKARMDDLRKKFEEGVTTFKAAGKDLYSLPWYLLVGPAGSGKTEALRHCNVGFPPGLQDPLQGSGGTLNMHWWFTNHAVVIDTAGRMFMEGAEDGGGAEWKEFLKLLKTARPNCPINGLLLVISSESLLKDSAEKIEATAGAIARQLDVIQRTLDVRFPVTVVVTKCDKIVGFRDFFETVTDPNLQHQILGWSNPAPLDEVFKPDQVDKHLETVRGKLMRRRLGLLQNPVHTADPTARRTDQVDELFELPDNLMRISPRLRRYLEMIFVAGEWSPKPLFLRGIYFTSSMREGQALDMSLASALGVEVESIPGSRDWERDKAYFLRDLFMSKVFKERGLVTRATNVSKQIRRSRALLIGAAIVTVVVLGGLTVLGWMQFKGSLKDPTDRWTRVRNALVGDGVERGPIEAKKLDLLAEEGSGADRRWTYNGRALLDKRDLEVTDDVVKTPVGLVEQTKGYSPVQVPVIFRPIVPSSEYSQEQEAAHRAVVEKTIILPLLRATRAKMQKEATWDDAAVRALAQLVRLQTYGFEKTPSIEQTKLSMPTDLASAASSAASLKKEKGPAIDADALFRYVLGYDAYASPTGYGNDRQTIIDAVARAYPNGFGDLKVSKILVATDPAWITLNEESVGKLAEHLKGLGDSRESKMGRLLALQGGLTKFSNAERKLRDMTWFGPGGAEGTPTPKTIEAYQTFETDVGNQLKELDEAKAAIDAAVKTLGAEVDDPKALFEQAEAALRRDMALAFQSIIDQLPAAAGDGVVAAAIGRPEPRLEDLRKLAERSKDEVDRAVGTRLATMKGEVAATAPMVVMGGAAGTPARAYAARHACYAAANAELARATTVPESRDGLLTDQLRKIDEERTRAVTSVGTWGEWTPDGPAMRPLDAEQQRGLTTDRNRTFDMMKRIVDVAADRRRHAAVLASVQSWEKDVAGVRGKVQRLAKSRIERGEAQRLEHPDLKMTAHKAGEEFKPEYHSAAAREVMQDWKRIVDLVGGRVSGDPPLLGARVIAEDRGFKTAQKSTEDYASEYVNYWRQQGTDYTMVTCETWQQFADVVSSMIPSDITRPADELQRITSDAIAAVPAGVFRDELTTDAKAELQRAFAGLKTKFAGDEFKTTVFKAWRDLASDQRGATGAVARLRGAYEDGSIIDSYLLLYSRTEGLRYWNEIVDAGIARLREATEKDSVEAWQALRTAAGVPVCLGQAGMPDLTGEEVQKALKAAQFFSSGPGAGGGGQGAAIKFPDPQLQQSIKALLGGNTVERDVATGQWFRKTRKVLGAITADGGLSATMDLWPADPAPPPGHTGTARDARDEFKYAAIFVNGRKVGEQFNINTADTIGAARLKGMAIPLPVQSAEIRFYNEDWKDQEPPVVARIPLAGKWAYLGAMLTRPGASAKMADKSWRVLLSDGTHYMWAKVTYSADLPDKPEWPSLEEWPAK